jgi:hypothetical protein
MRSRRVVLAVLALLMVGGVAYVAQNLEPSGVKMGAAAERFLNLLNEEQKQRATFGFADQERFNWHFVPLQDEQRKSTRKGLPLEAMNAEQRNAALELLRSATSLEGFRRATTIMSLESILRDLEKNGAMVRNPDWYFFSVFGKPGNGRWAWRVEGHHLSLNFTVEDGKVVSATPLFMGANPATVKEGPRKGLRTLAAAQDGARDLFRSLTEDQRQQARIAQHFPEIKARNQLPEVGEPVGLAASKLTEKQRGLLFDLLRAYTSSMPADVAEAEMKGIQEAGLDAIHFAWSGSPEEGQQHTYRVQGPTFVAEFLNVQEDSAKNPANHIHTCWRSRKNDFGLVSK